MINSLINRLRIFNLQFARGIDRTVLGNVIVRGGATGYLLYAFYTNRANCGKFLLASIGMAVFNLGVRPYIRECVDYYDVKIYGIKILRLAALPLRYLIASSLPKVTLFRVDAMPFSAINSPKIALACSYLLNSLAQGLVAECVASVFQVIDTHFAAGPYGILKFQNSNKIEEKKEGSDKEVCNKFGMDGSQDRPTRLFSMSYHILKEAASAAIITNIDNNFISTFMLRCVPLYLTKQRTVTLKDYAKCIGVAAFKTGWRHYMAEQPADIAAQERN